MWKIALALLLTALAILGLAYQGPAIQTRVGALTGTVAPAILTPPLIYAGVREGVKASAPEAAGRRGWPRHCLRF